MNEDEDTYRPFEALARKVAPGGRLLRLWALQGGISAETTALEIQKEDGGTAKMIVRRPGKAALKHNPQAARDEYRVLEVAQALGFAAPRPYLLCPPGETFPTPSLVMEYVEGEPEFDPADHEAYAIQFAYHLAQIHHAGVAQFDLSFLPRPEDVAARQLMKRPAALDHSLAEGRIRDTLEPVWPLAPRNPPRLLHGDYWPGNTLWKGNRLVAVIDWEDAMYGDPLADFAISRLDLLWIFGPRAMEAFTHHYLSRISLDTAHLPYWDLYAALRLARLAGADLAGWAAFFHPYGRSDISERSIREHYRYFVEQAFERINTSR